jgi:hypothetical protein
MTEGDHRTLRRIVLKKSQNIHSRAAIAELLITESKAQMRK